MITIICKCLLFVICIFCVECKVCTRQKRGVTSALTWYNDFVTRSYLTRCPGGYGYYNPCIKTKTVAVRRSKYETKLAMKTEQYCCDGYIQVDNVYTTNAADDLICEPICQPSCVNGTCVEPGVCSCSEGYIQSLNDSHICLPMCEQCENGFCAAPDICFCNFGYAPQNGTCQPICTEPCHNGTCKSPENCECHSGYRKSENNNCEPYCSTGCLNGICVAPETCECNPGWHKEMVNDSRGWDNLYDTCKLDCTVGYKELNGSCVPECKYSCGNGTCISPNVCRCFPGYKINVRKLLGFGIGPLCIPSCLNCDGDCVAPSTCVTNAGTSTTRWKSLDTDNTNVEETDSTITEWSTFVTEPSFTTDFYEELDFASTTNVYKEVLDDFEAITPANGSNSTYGKGSAMERTWIEEHWASVLLPVFLILAAAMIMLLVLRWTSFVDYFKGRHYVVNGDITDIDDCYQNVHFSKSNENVECKNGASL